MSHFPIVNKLVLSNLCKYIYKGFHTILSTKNNNKNHDLKDKKMEKPKIRKIKCGKKNLGQADGSRCLIPYSGLEF